MKARRLAVLFGAMGLVGLGCDDAPARPPASPVSFAARPDVTLRFVPMPGNDAMVSAVNGALQNQLVGAGYRIALDAKSPADANARLNVTTAEQPSMFTVVVNGQRRVTYLVTATLVLEEAGTIIDQVSTQFEAPNGQVNPLEVGRLVTNLSQSQRLVSFGQFIQNRRAQQAQQAAQLAAQQQQQAADEARRVQEEAWIKANPMGCQRPTSLSACEGVQLYLARYPTGAHAEEARGVLAASVPAFVALQRDEKVWATSGFEACLPGGAKDACDGVDIYVTKFPAGMHAGQAGQILNAARVRP